MIKCFNHKRTYRLECDGDSMTLLPLSFCDVPDKYAKDITFRKAVQAGEIEIFNDRKEAQAIENKVADDETKAAADTETTAKKTARKKVTE